MYRKYRLKFWIAIFLIGFSIPSYGQEKKISKEISLGFSIATGKELSKVYTLGIFPEIRIPVLIKEKIEIKPLLGYNFFQNSPAGRRETLHGFIAGVNFNYIVSLPDSQLKFYFGPSFLFCNYRDYYNDQYSGVSDFFKFGSKVFSLSVPSFDLRAGMLIKSCFIELKYQYLSATAKVDKNVNERYLDMNKLYQLYEVNDFKVNLSSLTLVIGLRF